MLNPNIETAVLKQSEETLHELCQAFENVGMSRGQIAMMLRAEADKFSPLVIVPTGTIQ